MDGTLYGNTSLHQEQTIRTQARNRFPLLNIMTITHDEDDHNRFHISHQCRSCKRLSAIFVDTDEFENALSNHKLLIGIDVFQDASTETRESLITALCTHCQHK